MIEAYPEFGRLGAHAEVSLYDAGNLVIWWMGVPAMAVAAVMAAMMSTPGRVRKPQE